MTEQELIAKQAMKIAEQDALVTDFCQRLGNIRNMLVCIGGPLNDNRLQYDKAQLVIFQRIAEECEI